MRLIDADRLKIVLEIHFGHTGGAAVLPQVIDDQPTVYDVDKGKLAFVFAVFHIPRLPFIFSSSSLCLSVITPNRFSLSRLLLKLIYSIPLWL